MSTVYDAGVLIAADRDDRIVRADHRARLEAGLVPVTTAPVVAQVSRSPRQVQLRRFLRGCDVVGFEPHEAHAVGTMLAKSGTTDVVDAHVALTAARTSATVITSSRHLAFASRKLGQCILAPKLHHTILREHLESQRRYGKRACR